jgi:RimJ/RimL family protein N-acetyltransferase
MEVLQRMEWIELIPSDRKILEGLFVDCLGYHGRIAPALDGGMGAALVDNPDKPRIALLQYDVLKVFAGEPIQAYVEKKIKGLLIFPDGEWEKLLRQIKGDHFQTRKRVAFEAGHWDRNCLRTQAQNIPDEFIINRVAHEDIAQFADFDAAFIHNFAGHSSFLEKGIGFCARHGTQIVAGCSSSMIGGGKLEIEIITHPDFRRRGLATAVAATMIDHCLANNLEPCWDAANEASVGLAEKLGFINARAYNAYWVES